MNESIKTDPKFLEMLKFRRQFLLGPGRYLPNKYWNTARLQHGLHLSVHKDLPFQTAENSKCRITVIGPVIDCTDPGKTQEEVASALLEQYDHIDTVISATKPLAGRWAVICQDRENTILFTDPCGQRKVYYYADGDECWCASQPALINQVKKMPPASNRAISEFRNSTTYKKKESKWFSNKTEFEGCFHLFPNHYLLLNNHTQVRFFPSVPLPVSENL